jgi:hypothetical protein
VHDGNDDSSEVKPVKVFSKTGACMKSTTYPYVLTLIGIGQTKPMTKTRASKHEKGQGRKKVKYEIRI